MIANSGQPVGERGIWRSYLRYRYEVLFYALPGTLLVIPVATTFGLPATFLKVLLWSCLLAAVMPNATRRSRHVILAAILLLAIATVGSEQRYLPVNPALVLVAVSLVGLASAGGALRFAIGAKTVSSAVLHAVLSTYLLAGLFFGQIYWSIERISPGSLIGPDPVTEQTAVYYSFVTLATLGYGDFLPRTDLVRGVATFEVIGGQLFLAVLVARLISAFSRP